MLAGFKNGLIGLLPINAYLKVRPLAPSIGSEKLYAYLEAV